MIERGKKMCPFMTEKRALCSTKCEWFDDEQRKCVVYAISDRINSFTGILEEYILTYFKILRAKDD